MNLERIDSETPTLRVVGDMSCPTYGVFQVPIEATDGRGTTRVFTRQCVAIDRNPRQDGSPVLLSLSTLQDLRIVLDAGANRWFYGFDTQAISLQSTKEFSSTIKNEACVYAIITLLTQSSDDKSSMLARKEDAYPVELQEFADVFDSDKAGTLPPCRDTDHAIDLHPDQSPPYGPIYPLAQNELQVLREYIERERELGRIRESKSPAGAPILFVPKKDGSLRLCVDYRGLNKVTVKNRYALPLMAEILDRVQGAKYFSKIDVKDAYYRIRIKEGDEWKTAFRTRYGHYEYVVMPFGLTNAPATFQSYIHKALHGLLDDFCIAYLDDILIFSRERESHTQHLARILKRLRGAQLYANPAKCTFYQGQVEFLGFIISAKGTSMDPSRVDTISTWPQPRSFHDIQVFLGFCNFYRRFIEGYSRIAKPLNDLLKGMQNGRKPGSVELGIEETRAFRLLREAFTQAPLLRHFDPASHIRLETDASDFAISGIISQPSERGQYHPVAFWSRKLKGPELVYGTHDKEMMAIIESFKHWRQYLQGSSQTIEVLSDHENLQVFMKQPKLNGRQARWCMFLAPFDFVIKHRSGKSNPADAPSRRPDYVGEEPPSTKYLPALQAKMAIVQEVQSESSIYTAQVQALAGVKGVVPHHTARNALVGETIYESRSSTEFLDIIQKAQGEDPEMRRRRDTATGKNRLRQDEAWTTDLKGLVRFKGAIYVPEVRSIKDAILELYHDDPLSGHFGRGKTEELIRRQYYWKHLGLDIAEWINSCDICQGAKSKRHRPYGLLKSLPLPQGPWQEISMDFITGFPESEDQEKPVNAVLVVVDRFTKMSRFLPVNTTITSVELAELIHREIELRYGAPKGIVSDRGSVFTSDFWSALCYHSKIRKRLSTAFHPQTDGQTERANQVLETYLRCFTTEQQAKWPILLPEAEFAVNNSRSQTTGTTPFFALYGYHPEIRTDVVDDVPERGVPAAAERVIKLEELRVALRIHWQNAIEAQQKHYDKRRTDIQFHKGNLVGLSTRNLKLKSSPKMTPKFIGPFRVLDVIGTSAYRIALPNKYSRLHNVFPVSLLEPWTLRKGSTPAEYLQMPDLDDPEDEWEVDEVRGKRVRNKIVQYLVKWAGWPTEYNQWIAEADMENARNKVHQYEKTIMGKQKVSFITPISGGSETVKPQRRLQGEKPAHQLRQGSARNPARRRQTRS